MIWWMEAATAPAPVSSAAWWLAKSEKYSLRPLCSSPLLPPWRRSGGAPITLIVHSSRAISQLCGTYLKIQNIHVFMVRMSACVYVSVPAYVSVCLCICLCICLCMCQCIMHLPVCVSVSMSVSTPMYVSLYNYVSVYDYVRDCVLCTQTTKH